ncbi:hypothetical protein B6C97_07635 [Gilliamella apis]|uniref:Glycosyltransferase family 2 protein n=3 Tax=Gilliamella apis TaxID=1970738 RepID=A0A242NTH0_9GAMM|nr:hypothetical protein B6C84_02020 [Gilliamella apis]OTQ37895.1 hypothetical protein B6C88_04070 [Gilliamella apis]OTQ43633.1 hypothetical protein B6C94_02870 [Gilliamella apis]OTQ47322.1 hypothetical protein B6C86_01455 [Gilliamella apis]OTQ48957.1 hypothetical protein B6D06_08530 [Gilliamella apis]
MHKNIMDSVMKIAICAIAKEEGLYLTEWIAYHKLLGFDIIIADNGGDDNTSSLLQKFHANKIIYRINFIDYPTSPQIPAYRALARVAKKLKYDIIIFLDIDEFFSCSFPPKELIPENGVDYVSNLFNKHKLSQLSLHWICYGSKTDTDDTTKPVLSRFMHHSNEEEFWNVNTKSFVKINEYFTFLNWFYKGPPIFGVHFQPTANKKWLIDNTLYKKMDFTKKNSYNNGCILHFQLKSWAEYQRKIKRGDAAFTNNKNNKDYFKVHDYNYEKTELSEVLLNQLTTQIHRYNELNIIYKKSDNIDGIHLSKGLSNVGDQFKIKYKLLMFIKNLFGL